MVWWWAIAGGIALIGSLGTSYFLGREAGTNSEKLKATSGSTIVGAIADNLGLEPTVVNIAIVAIIILVGLKMVKRWFR